MKDFSEKRKDRIGIVSALVVIAIILSAKVLWASAVQVPIRMHFGDTQDSVRVQVRAFNTVVGTFVKASTGLVDTILSLGDETVWQVYARAYKAPDSARSWTFQLNRSYSQGPIDWPIEMYWSELTDSVRCKFYKDSTVDLSFLITGKQSFDSAFTCNRGDGVVADTAYSLVADMYYQGQTIPASWLWSLEWRRLDTGTIIQSPSATLCRLYAFVKHADWTPARGADVIVTRGGPYNSVSTSDPRYALTTDIVSRRTDSLGKFQVDVVASGQFADTANAYYNVTCKWKRVELFSIKHLWAPAGQSVDVLDTLVARQ